MKPAFSVHGACVFLLFATAGCSSSSGGAGPGSGSTPSDAGKPKTGADAASDAAGQGTSMDGAGGSDDSDTEDAGDDASDASSAAVDATDSAATSSCAPCSAALESCIDVGPALITNFTPMQVIGGTCKLGGLTLNCGGTGTNAQNAALTWSVTSSTSTLVITTGSILLNCHDCPAGESQDTCNAMWAQ